MMTFYILGSENKRYSIFLVIVSTVPTRVFTASIRKPFHGLALFYVSLFGGCSQDVMGKEHQAQRPFQQEVMAPSESDLE